MSLAVLEAAIEGLDLVIDGDDLARAFAARDRLDVQLALAAAEFEATGQHELDGAATMPSWLRSHAGCDVRTASKTTGIGRKLRRLPVLRDAALAGRLSGGQLDAVLANVPMRHLERFVDHEAAIVPRLVDLDVDGTRRAMEAWRRHADAVDEDRPPAEHDNELHLSRTLHGRGELHGSFDADLTAIVEAALRVADPNDRTRTLCERRAEALGQVCQHFLDHQQTRTGGRHRPHLNVRIDLDELLAGVGGRYIDTDQPVSPATLGVLSCDSAFHRFLWSGASGVLDYGRATRAWPVDIYNAIVLRDGGCRFPGCDAPPSWCDVHHVTFWEDGGDTSVDDGVLGCRRHHRLVHTDGYHLKLRPDGTVDVTFPDGHVETSAPRGLTTPRLWIDPPDTEHGEAGDEPAPP